MINIVIPMAGKGSRFENGEYKSRKPFLEFNGSFMIEQVMNNLMPKEEHRFILIMQKIDFENEIVKIEAIKKSYNVEIVQIEFYTEGPVATALFARHLFNDDEKFLLANCDQYVDFDVNEYIAECNQYDGSILIFKDLNAEPKWSFVEKNIDNTIKRVVAKEVVSENVVVGLYLWKYGKDFVENSIDLIINNDRANGEFFQCPVYNYAIAKGKKFSAFEVEFTNMYALGVPIDYEESCKKIETFTN